MPFKSLFSPFLLGVLLCFNSLSAAEKAVSLDFMDTPITEVVRLISLAYDTPVLVDDTLDFKVTFHLDGVGVLEALTALCSAHGLELVQRESIFHVRRANNRGKHEFSRQGELISLSVKDKEVNEFVREFALNSGMNVLASPGLEGKISGDLHRLPAESAFRALMNAHGFRVWRENECLRVGRGSAAPHSPEEKIQLWKDGDMYTAEIDDGELSQVLNRLAEVAELNLALYGDIRETVRLKLHGVPLERLILRWRAEPCM